MKFAVGLISLFLISCASLPNLPFLTEAIPPSNLQHQLILRGKIDGIPFVGTGIGSDAKRHELLVTSPVTVNYFTMQSCHRSEQFPDFIEKGWFDKKKTKLIIYEEAPQIEDTGDCILRLCAFSRELGAPPAACAVIDFKSPKYTLPGENICNGAVEKTTGTSICHTQVGLIERFRFPVPVVTAPSTTPDGVLIKGQCQGKFIDTQNTLWEYRIPKEECTIIFMERAKPHRRAKLTVIPYDVPAYYGGK